MSTRVTVKQVHDEMIRRFDALDARLAAIEGQSKENERAVVEVAVALAGHANRLEEKALKILFDARQAVSSIREAEREDSQRILKLAERILPVLDKLDSAVLAAGAMAAALTKGSVSALAASEPDAAGDAAEEPSEASSVPTGAPTADSLPLRRFRGRRR